MKRAITLFTFLVLFLSVSQGQSSNCSSQSQARILALMKPYVRTLCQGELACAQLALRSLRTTLNCVSASESVKDVRPQATAFMYDPEFRKLIEARYFKNVKNDSTGLRKKIWDEFSVLVLPGGVSTPLENTKDWAPGDLQILYAAYRDLRTALAHAVGEEHVQEFSHIWGAGGSIARRGSVTVGGQFGEVYNIYPLQVNVVADLAKTGFRPQEVAQRLAHENGHSQDYILGALYAQDVEKWTDSPTARIFSYCRVKNPSSDVELYGCAKAHTRWFNFHPTLYAAANSSEFYAKMIDEWVRENLGLVKKARYRCQSVETYSLWREMESHLLGEVISSDCSF